MQLDENIPYTAQMIATITRQQVGTVERALQIFMKLGLVEPLPSGALYMSNIELLIGQLLDSKFWSPPTALYCISKTENSGRIASQNHASVAVTAPYHNYVRD